MTAQLLSRLCRQSGCSSTAGCVKRGRSGRVVDHKIRQKLEGDVRLAVGNVALHRLDVDLSDGCRVRGAVHVNVHDVLGDSLFRRGKSPSRISTRSTGKFGRLLRRGGGDSTYRIPSLVVLVLDEEDHVETGQDGRRKVNVLAGGLHVVVPTKDRVGRGEDRRSRVQDGRDTGLGDRDSLCTTNKTSCEVSHLSRMGGSCRRCWSKAGRTCCSIAS